MWNGGQLPWGKPYFQDVRQMMLQTDPGYQQARQWWSQQHAQVSADAERVRQWEAELDKHRAQYSKLEADHGRTVADIDRLERIWSLPRGEAPAHPEAGAKPPRAKRAQFAGAPGPLPDAGGPSSDVRGPERPAEPPDAGSGEGADPVDEA
jgi:hypothetical protein